MLVYLIAEPEEPQEPGGSTPRASPLDNQLDIRGISFEMHIRRQPLIPEVVFSASTDDNSIVIGSPPNYGYLFFYVRESVMRTLWPGRYVGDVRAKDERFTRVALTIDLTILEGVTR